MAKTIEYSMKTYYMNGQTVYLADDVDKEMSELQNAGLALSIEFTKLGKQLDEAESILEDVQLTGEHANFCKSVTYFGHNCTCMDRSHYNEKNNSKRAKEYFESKEQGKDE